MSGLIKSTLQFHAKMDAGFSHEILALLAAVEDQSRQCAQCELIKAEPLNEWIVECAWTHKSAMLDHFTSQPLQDIIQLLASRSSRIMFESTADVI